MTSAETSELKPTVSQLQALLKVRDLFESKSSTTSVELEELCYEGVNLVDSLLSLLFDLDEKINILDILTEDTK